MYWCCGTAAHKRRTRVIEACSGACIDVTTTIARRSTCAPPIWPYRRARAYQRARPGGGSGGGGSGGGSSQQQSSGPHLMVEGHVYAIGSDWLVRAGNVILSGGAVKGMLVEVRVFLE